MKKIIFAFLLAVLTAALLCVPSGAAWLSSEAPVLKYGSTGNYVTQLQQDLNTLGYGLSTDGSFGPATLNVVKDYQAQMGLEVDGSVGPATKSSIISTINSYESSTSIQIPGTAAITRGNKGIRVRFLQRMLCLLGYPLDIDGSFGSATYEAVRSFQRDYGITVDGSCGPETIRYINGAILGTYSPKPIQTEPPITTTVPETTTIPVTTTTTAAAPIATAANSVSKAVDTLIPTIAVENSNGNTTSPATMPQISSGSALKYGSKGERVKELQRCLVYLGWSLDIDGSFGPSTKSAVMEFQRRCGLSVDGSCGPATTAKINEACAGGNVFSNDTEDSGVWGSDFGETTTAKTTTEAKKTTSETSVPHVKKIQIVRDSIGTLGDDIIPLGHSVKLTAKISPDNAITSVKWKSSNSKYLKVSSDGTVTGVKETPNGDAIASFVGNTVTITATADNGVKAVRTFRVVEYKPKSIEIKLGGTVVKDGGTFTLNVGDTAKIKSTLSPTYANPLLTWKVSDPEIAEIKDDKILTKKIGKTKVTCKTINSKVTVTFNLEVSGKSVEEIKGEIESAEKELSKRNGYQSYNGKCGMYTRTCLEVYGILKDNSYFTEIRPNREDSYDGAFFFRTMRELWEKNDGNKYTDYNMKFYENTNNYDVGKLLYELTDGGKRPTYNIVLCFPKSYYNRNCSCGKHKAGHVMFINAIIGDQIYYTECFSPEKTLRVGDGFWGTGSFEKSYPSNRYGNPIGYIVFEK